MTVELVSVAAVADNLVIGVDGALPWQSLPADRRQYRERVADEPVVVGRVTFESMREDPPGRAQLVLSRTERCHDLKTAHHVGGVDEAIETAAGLGATRAYVLGGGTIYRLFQPHLDRMVLSRVPGEYEGDAYYPEWDADAWERTDETAYERFTVETWVRTSGGTDGSHADAA